MCFGGKSKEVQAPKPQPPTTFDYNIADKQQRMYGNTVPGSQEPTAAANNASFGSELSAPAQPGASALSNGGL